MVTTYDAKTLLLDAAKTLFSKKGFEGVSVREIAAEANVHFGLVRYHFGDKEGLYRACIQSYGQKRLDSAKRFLEKPTSVEDFSLKLKYAIEDIIEIQIQDPLLTQLVLREAEAEHSMVDDILGDTLINMAKCFIDFFSFAKRRGFIHKDVNPQFVTHMIQGTINHYVRTDAIRLRHFNYSLKDSANKQNLANQLHQLILHGCLVEKK